MRHASPPPTLPRDRGDARRAAFVLLALSFGGAAALGGAPPRAFAQGAPPAAAPVATSPQQDRLTQAQLEQLLAPIALHPDDLLMQMLMAATYPLEIVQAKRWLGQGQNAALRGDALVAALNAQSWDPSVKSLVPFPDVLGLMNDQLEWTQQLGDAVLGQQEDVLNTIQVLRGRAQANGSLQSGPQQTVSVTQNVTVAPAQGAVVAPPPQVITIAPTQPETVFVPVYDPNVVFGTWPHASYPPTFFPPPVGWGVGNALLTGMAFAGGAAIVGSLWGWGSPNWGRGDINVNANRYNNINVNRPKITDNSWQHNAQHRGPVPYRDKATREKFGKDSKGREKNKDFSGFDKSKVGDRTDVDRVKDKLGDRDVSKAKDKAGDRDLSKAKDKAGDRDLSKAKDKAGDRDLSKAKDKASDRDASKAKSNDKVGSGKAKPATKDVKSTNKSPKASPKAMDVKPKAQVKKQVDRGNVSRKSAASHPKANRGGGGGGRGGGRGGGGRR